MRRLIICNFLFTVSLFLTMAATTTNCFVIVPDMQPSYCYDNSNNNNNNNRFQCRRHRDIVSSYLNHAHHDGIDDDCYIGNDSERTIPTHSNTLISRRNLLMTTTATTTTGGLLLIGGVVTNIDVANAATASSTTTTNYQTYNDEKYGFSIKIPKIWNEMNEVTSLGDRRSIVIYTDPNVPSTSMIIVYTPIRDDYTSLNSFGSVDQVATQTILPKSTLLDEDSNIVAQMLSATSTKQSYLFDYIQQIPQKQQPLTHYRTIFTLCTPKAVEQAAAVAGAMLVTITLQTPQSQYILGTKTKDEFDTIIDSYQRT